MSDQLKPFEIIELVDGVPGLRVLIFDPQQIAAFPIGHESGGARVFAFRMDDLTTLLQSLPQGFITDRGAKLPARSLAGYFTGRSGLVALRANYVDPGQAGRGLRALHAAGTHYTTRTSCFIGIGSAVFAALVRRAGPPLRGPEQTGGYDDLRGLLDDSIAVPESVRKKYLGASERVEWVRRSIVLATRIKFPILIQGESGTGKEIVARQIHDLRQRRAESFVAVNCGGIPSELFESELFGHMRGAFSGADSFKKGLWTLADKGTLFLDEIGDLTLHHQVKVLRALEDGCYYPVGAETITRSEARIIAATNRDLAAMVGSGQFREDLYYRLFTFRIRTPALREHREDIPQLARYFWANIRDNSTLGLTNAVTDLLAQFRWPGNARELRAFLINLMLMANGRKIDVPLVHAVMRERLGPALLKEKDS